MPALPSATGVFRVRFSWTDGFRDSSWAIHLSDGHNLAYTLGDAEALADACNTWQNSHEVGLHPDSTTSAGVVVTDLTSDTGVEAFANTPTAGSTGSKSLPLNVALLQKIPIARRYRGGHGHVFIPFISDSFDYTGETWHSTDITNFDAIMTALITAFEGLTSSHGSPYSLGVLSYFTGHAERVTPVFQTSAAGFQTQPRVCTRRKRLPKISG